MSSPAPSARIGIVGLGLIGGSLARALKRLDEPPRIVASSLEPDDLRRAVEEGVADRVHDDPGPVASDADLVVYATPLGATLELLGEHRGLWAPGAVLTDVAGLKEPVVRRAAEAGVGERFVGAHPMAGTEERGYPASRPDLFRGARVHLVRGDAHPDTSDRVAALWTSVGARPAWTDAREHDERMVWASHLPQLVSNAVAAVLAERGLGPGDLGTGGLDVTRLAASPPELWAELLLLGSGGASEALRAAAGELEALAKVVAGARRTELVAYMEATRRWSRGEGETR